MSKRTLRIAIACPTYVRVVTGLCIITVLLGGCSKKETAASAIPDVECIEVAQKDLPVTRQWVATLDGYVNAQIRAQVKGLLVKQNYTNGSFVRKNEPLFEIDPRPFQAAMNQANANLEQA